MSLGLYFDSTVVFSKFICSKTRFHFLLNDSISGHKCFNGKYQLNFPTGSSTGDVSSEQSYPEESCSLAF